MIVYINKFDNDYHTITDHFNREFTSVEEAEQWCEDESWSGYTYYVDKSMTEALNS